MADEGKTAADVQLGTLAKDKVPDNAIADAAFELQSGQVSDPVQGAFGSVLVRVTAITPEVVKPLAEVSDQIRKDIALGEANRILLDVHDSYEDARAGGASLKDAADKLKLKLVTIDAVDVTGKRPDETIINDLPASAELLRGVFEAEPNTENPPINSGSNGFVFYEVEGITPARERALDEVQREGHRRLEERTGQQPARRESRRNCRSALTDGTAMDALAAELKLEKQTKRGLKREANDPDFGQEGVSAVFDHGRRRRRRHADVRRELAACCSRSPKCSSRPAPTPAASRKRRARHFGEGLPADMLDELVARLRGEFDVEVNRTAAQQALQLQ